MKKQPEPRRRILSDEISSSTEWKIRLMGMNGFYARTIAAKLRIGGYANLTNSQIYRCLHQNDISLRAYREGWGPHAAAVFKREKLGAALPDVIRKKKKHAKGLKYKGKAIANLTKVHKSMKKRGKSQLALAQLA
jgi:hypothetical protein